jgi:hypothetical protein
MTDVFIDSEISMAEFPALCSTILRFLDRYPSCEHLSRSRIVFDSRAFLLWKALTNKFTILKMEAIRAYTEYHRTGLTGKYSVY